MTEVLTEHDTSRSHDGAPIAAEQSWSAIATSLEKLETGLHKLAAELGRMHADLEAFTQSLEDFDEGGRHHGPR